MFSDTNAECNIKALNAECHYAECRCAECCGAAEIVVMQLKLAKSQITCREKLLIWVSYQIVYQSTEIAPKNLIAEMIPSQTIALPFWELDWPVKWKRTDLGEMISECSVANIDTIEEFKGIKNFMN